METSPTAAIQDRIMEIEFRTLLLVDMEVDRYGGFPSFLSQGAFFPSI